MKCKECKFRCHTLCQSLVPPSCGLPDDLIQHFMHHLTSEGSPILPRSQPTSLVQPPFHSSSSSCNSSTPSSPQVGSSCIQGEDKEKTAQKATQENPLLKPSGSGWSLIFLILRISSFKYKWKYWWMKFRVFMYYVRLPLPKYYYFSYLLLK